MKTLFTVFLLGLAAAVPSLAAPASTLFLVDDRGVPIETPVEVCLVIALERTCSEIVGGRLELPPGLDFLTVEGEDHGPVSLSGTDLERGEDGSLRAVVRRKATLRFAALPPAGAEMNLYQVDDADFHRPLLRRPLEDGDAIRVPADRFLLSLVGEGLAPDLRELNLEPAQELELKLRRRPGGAIVLRTRARGNGNRGGGPVVAEAKVRLLASSLNLVQEAEPPRLGEARTSVSGLALFSGIELPAVDAALEHPSFLPEVASALAIEPGLFTFREVVLEQGATLVGRVSLDGEVLPGARCRLLDYDRTPGSDAPPKRLWSAVTDAAGICRGERLREGAYLLRIAAPVPGGRPRQADLPVALTEGEITNVEAALQRVILEGVILRGEDPAPGFRVVVHDLEARKPYAREPDAAGVATADEEGQYSLTLWRPGSYLLLVRGPRGPTTLFARTELHAGSQVRDFELGRIDVEGRVVDERDTPIRGASVVLTWQDHLHTLASTDEEGRFSLSPDDDSGIVRVWARKEGFLPSEPIEVELAPGRPPAPIVVVLHSDGGFDGRLVGADGPVAGGTVVSYQEEPFANPRWRGQVATDSAGFFRVPRAKSGSTRIYYTGPGCPLGSRRLPTDFDGSEEVWQVNCSPTSVSVELVLRNPDLSPRSGGGILLLRNGLAFPREVLAAHLARARLPFVSDAGGRLLLAGLEPGIYDLYLAEATSPIAVRMGLDRGFLATVQLAPSTERTLEVVLQEPIPQESP